MEFLMSKQLRAYTQVGMMALGLIGAMNSVSAKDLTSRLGVGYANQMSIEAPSIQVQYYPSAELGLSADLGVDTAEDSSKFGILVKAYKVVFTEENMNFYMGAGVGLISQEESGNNDSGFEVNGIFGGQFFIPGLDSLAMSFEAGVGVSSVSSEVRFRTIGHSPLNAGMVFFF